MPMLFGYAWICACVDSHLLWFAGLAGCLQKHDPQISNQAYSSMVCTEICFIHPLNRLEVKVIVL